MAKTIPSDGAGSRGGATSSPATFLAVRVGAKRHDVAAWCGVAGAFMVLMTSFGAIYSYAAFADEIALCFAIDRSAMALVFALSGGGCFLVSAISGPLADCVGTRAVATFGILLIGTGLTIAATARTLTEVYFGYGLLTGIGAGFAYVPAMAAVQRSFDTRRGLASGIAISGIGIGTVLVPPAAGVLAAFGDWRVAFLLSSVSVIVVGCAGAMLLPTSKAVRHLDQGPVPAQTRAFGLTYLGTLLLSMPGMLPHAALVSSARDIGLSRSEALALLALLGTGSILGRFLLAVIADMTCRRRTFLVCCSTMGASMGIWASADDVWALRIFAVAFGAAQGGFVALLPTFIADQFGIMRCGWPAPMRWSGVNLSASSVCLRCPW